MASRPTLNWKVLDTLIPILEKEGWSHAQMASDWGISAATLEAHLTQTPEVTMGATLKHDYSALFEEYDRKLAGGESPKEIRATFESRGVNWGTFQNRRSQANKEHRSTPEEHQVTPTAHRSTPPEDTMTEDVVEVLPGQMSLDADTANVHPGTPEHLSTPEPTEILSDEQYTQEHLSTLQDADPTEVHPGTLEGHQEVMEEVHQSVPDAPHLGTEEPYPSIAEHPSTPEVPQELSPDDSSMAHSGVPARQEHGISTPIVHPGTPSEEDWELWHTIKARWLEVEKMLAERHMVSSTPTGTPEDTQKKTYVFTVRHIALIEAYAQAHRLDLKDVIYSAFQEFFERRGYMAHE